MNELVRDFTINYVPTKFDRNQRRIAPGRALTGLCLPTDRRTDGRTDGQSHSSIHPFQLRNYSHHKMYYDIHYLFTDFNDVSVEVWEWMNNLIPHFILYVIVYPCWRAQPQQSAIRVHIFLGVCFTIKVSHNPIEINLITQALSHDICKDLYYYISKNEYLFKGK